MKIEYRLTIISGDDISDYSEKIIDKIVELIPSTLEIEDEVIFIDSIEYEEIKS